MQGRIYRDKQRRLAGQECFGEENVRRMKREDHKGRTEESGVGRGAGGPREGRACTEGGEALPGWREVWFAIALNAVNSLVWCLSVNIQFSLIHVLLGKWKPSRVVLLLLLLVKLTHEANTTLAKKISVYVTYA